MKRRLGSSLRRRSSFFPVRARRRKVEFQPFVTTGGLWRNFPATEFGTWRGLLEKLVDEPGRFASFLHSFLLPFVGAMPNECHHAVRGLQEKFGASVITQNIDGLHQQAGSTDVLEIHGSLFNIVDEGGTTVATRTIEDLADMVAGLAPLASGNCTFDQVMEVVRPFMGQDDKGLYRPGLVLFEDELDSDLLSRARDLAGSCDCMIIVGTSGDVFPANLLPVLAKAQQARVVAVGPERPKFECDLWLDGSAARILPSLLP